jgi:hypothetical protein
MKKFGIFLMLLNLTNSTYSLTVNYTISPQFDQTTISQYIYGSNWDLISGENLTFYRSGGNRLTGYNWVNNASNAGNDWYFSSDNYLTGSTPEPQASTPGLVLTTFYDSVTSKNAKGIITLPMAGYVAKDKSGNVDTTTQVAPSSRWCKVMPFKGSAFTLNPTLASNSVYIDECVSFLTTKYHIAANGGVKAYDLDNEPGLWSSTHYPIHSTKVTCTELVQRSSTWSMAIKSVDSTADIFGCVFYGFNDFYSLQDAPDWGAVGSGYNWFTSYYLDKMRVASNASGKRLLDVIDFHYYSEAQGDHRITDTNSGNDTQNDKLARLQAPRTLWNKNYIENSWIGQWFSTYLPIIPTIQTSINQYYPGTKIAFTEYNFGAPWDITGGIAQADTLGIFGKYGIYAANLWPLGGSQTYASLAFKMYRNYNGSKATFGDINVRALMSDTANSSIYASILSKDSSLHLIVLNKSMTESISGDFTITSSTTYSSGVAYTVSSSSSVITGPASVTVTSNHFTYSLAPLSITHFIFNPVIVPVELSKFEAIIY